MINKLKYCFDDMVVFKDQRKTNSLSSLNLKSFMRDWLVKRFSDEDGNYDEDALLAFVSEHIPSKDDWGQIKDNIVKNGIRAKILAKILCDTDVKTAETTFSLEDYGLKKQETEIDSYIWEMCKINGLVPGREVYGMLELGYRQPVYGSGAKPTIPGKINLLNFQNFCPYTINTDFYKDVRNEFTIDEWLDVLLGAVDYRAEGFQNTEEKLSILTRLLPFVEKNLNLIELAPAGTGKSYIYGNVSRFGWIVGGSNITRAKMFYDISRKADGLVTYNDFVTLDEVSKMDLSQVDEVVLALRSYLEYGYLNVGTHRVDGDAGLVLCGNIDKEIMDTDGTVNMFDKLPRAFNDAVLLDRFHGFIKGWNIPRISNDHLVSGWALNSEYFCLMMHELREDTSYNIIVDALINEPKDADTRDTKAIKRIATAYLKLFFPNVRKPDDITCDDFYNYCLKRACEMRATIKMQQGILDIQYRGQEIPDLTINEELCKM